LRTTVQGTQQDGVEFGHEHRDIDARAIARWFVILGAIILFTYVSMLVMLRATIGYQAKSDRLASPLATAREVPPEPYIEGLTLGGAVKAGTHEHLEQARAREDATLQKWGLSSAEKAKTGRRTAPIPEGIVRKVAELGQPVAGNQAAADAPNLERTVPSDSTGGHQTGGVHGDTIH
jgi:hypothetical protein